MNPQSARGVEPMPCNVNFLDVVHKLLIFSRIFQERSTLMNISNIQNTYRYNSSDISINSTSSPISHCQGISSSSNSKDTVTLSAEGMKASENSQRQGLEQFRMPSWRSQYYPKQMDLSLSSQAVEETRQLFQMHDKFNSDGHISSNEQELLTFYRHNNMTANQTMRDNHEFCSKYKNELAEYGEKLNNYYAEAMEEQGVNQSNYYEKVLHAEGDNESLHQSFKEKILTDPRILELMDVLGIKRTD